MKIPKTLKIGGNVITVKRLPSNEMNNDTGVALWEQNVLQMAEDIVEDREATVFLHEILHFINIYLTEKETTFISEGLIQVIRDNNLDFRKQDGSRK